MFAHFIINKAVSDYIFDELSVKLIEHVHASRCLLKHTTRITYQTCLGNQLQNMHNLFVFDRKYAYREKYKEYEVK